MTPLAQRATRALHLARAADPDHTDRDTSQPTRRLRAHQARELAALLGVDPGHVIATADPNRAYGSYPGHLLTITDTTTYRFIPELGTDTVFYLLGPCPGCGAEVPVADIAQLADLGHHLTAGSPAPFHAQRWDTNHQPRCPHGGTD